MFESDFVPSVQEPTPEERAYALNLLNESLKRNLRSTVEELPPDAQDILWRDDVVMHERAVFERDDTSIIPERILKPGEPLQLGDILNMLSVYFWWN
ncbi:MAG TPA: hypothetical protein VFH39_02205, partial [Candidatus Saccharimonadales bacterium]|nr:hypothetical protein [Candidatus Saccharimonadales bacterium]